MKKLLLILAASGCACFAQADTMSFITVLSSPVGSFNKLETADTSVPAKGNVVNFCTKVGVNGTVALRGTQRAELAAVNLSSGTVLGKTDAGKYSLSQITLHNGGTVRGGRLLAATATVTQPAVGKSNALYGDTLTLAGAKTTKLDVGNGNSVMSNTGSDTEMVWSNEYQSDTACGNTTACAKQYLLKQKGGSSLVICQPTNGDTYSEDCPNGQEGKITYRWSYSACKYGVSSTCTSGTYVWAKQPVAELGASCTYECAQACYSNSLEGGVLDQGLPSINSLPATYPANHWAAPTCNAANKGKVCTVKAQRDSMSCNCVQYQCQAQ